jgi:hypothetical protein
LGTTKNPQLVKLNTTLDEQDTINIEAIFLKYKDIFAWNYIDLKGIPP